jgi:bifunctional ADP-heptose synthase (sugar kinase/adenylyltransferase)
LDALLPLAKRHDLLVSVDAHGALARFTGVTLVTPNQPEAERELGRELGTLADVRSGAAELRERLEVGAVLVTLGEAGMMLGSAEAAPVWIPAAEHVLAADPTGAGDTVAAAMTTAMLGGGTLLESALLADLAARIVVRRLGAAVASAEQLAAEANG